MAYRIIYAAEVRDDLERIAEHLEAFTDADAPERLTALSRSIETLEVSPYLGRPLLHRRGRRELVVGRRSRGYVVRYSIDEEARMVLVLGIRGQREGGFSRDGETSPAPKRR